MALSDVLDAREERWRKKCALCGRLQRPVVSLTLRMPIEIRKSEDAQNVFERAKDALFGLLLSSFSMVSPEGVFQSADGPYALFSVEAEGERVKRRLIQFEENTLLGELSDADVMAEPGREISRTEAGGFPRKCLVCGRADARACLSKGAHSRGDTIKTIEEKIFKALK